jgi:Tfp pilus assembly protein PilF
MMRHLNTITSNGTEDRSSEREYKIKFGQPRFGAGELHIKNGLKLREQGDLENAAAELQKAASIDPSSVMAEQELRAVLEMIDEKKRGSDAASEPPPENGTL